MSHQYLYTSARRGLEPGKSGFCCVARDRELPVDLARELDRLSRYDRIPGRSSPLILRHLSLSLRSGEYQVLSRLRDAGADYSKRNNHIAHHLAFAKNEAVELPDPATILLYWKGWKDAWLEPPRILNERDQFDIRQIATPSDSPNERFQGLVANDRIVKTPVLVEEGQELDLALHYRNELLKLPARDRWSVPFTNFILASDRPTDFAWLSNWQGRDLPFELTAAPDPKASSQADLIPDTVAARKPASKPTSSRKFAVDAPTVEIPEEINRKSRRRPKRKWTRKRISRTLNVGLATLAAICTGVIAYLAYNYKNPSQPGSLPTVSPAGEESNNAAAETGGHAEPLAQWKKWVADNELLESIEEAMPIAVALHEKGHPQALSIASTLAQVSRTDEDIVGIPQELAPSYDKGWTLPQPLFEELTGLPFALVPSSLQSALSKLETYPVERVYELLRAHTFLSEDSLIGLAALKRTAKDRIASLDLNKIGAARAYRTQMQELENENRIAPLRQLEAAFEINALSGFFSVDDDGLLLNPDDSDITSHLVALYERFLMPRFSSFDASPEFRQALRETGDPFETPTDAAKAIYSVLESAQAETASLQSRLERIRSQWRATFIRDDLMEEALIQFTFEGLASSKAQLARLQAQFDRKTLQAWEQAEGDLRNIEAAESNVEGLNAGTQWILVPQGALP